MAILNGAGAEKTRSDCIYVARIRGEFLICEGEFFRVLSMRSIIIIQSKIGKNISSLPHKISSLCAERNLHVNF